MLLTVLLASVCLPASALAANQRVLLQLFNLRQWVDSQSSVSAYARKVSGETDSSQSFSTNLAYGIALDYAILNRRLAQGKMNFSLGGGVDGQRSDSSSSGDRTSADYNLEYRADLLLFKRRPYSLYMQGQQKSTLVNPPFSDSYTLLNTHYQANLSLRNDFIPVNFSYNHVESETSGAAADRTRVTDRFALNGRHKIGHWMQTSAQFDTVSSENKVSGREAEPRNESYSLSASNEMNWDVRSYPNSLRSTYSLRETTGGRDFKTVRWDEELRTQLGRALKIGATHRYDKQTLEGNSRTRSTQSGWLRHRLYRSLDSDVRYTTGKVEFAYGAQNFWTRSLGINYSKTLPYKNRLNLSYSTSYGVNENKLNLQRLQTVDESQTVAVAGVHLNNTDIDVATIDVYSQDRTISYLQGVDYDIVSFGDRVILEFFNVGLSGIVAEGDQISVDYQYEVDRSIEYSTTTHNAGASLDMLNNRYRLHFMFSKVEQDLLSGGTSSTSFGSSHSLRFGLNGNLQPFRFDTSFEYQVAPDSVEKSFTGRLNYVKRMAGGQLNVNLNEVYSVLEQERLAGKRWRNTIDLNADFKKLYGAMQIRYRGRFVDMRNDVQEKNELELQADFEYRWRKLVAQLLIENTWLFSEADSTELTLRLNLRRYF